MRIVEHLTALFSRVGHAMSARLLAKTRRAPSRHCTDGRVYGLKTTAMHETRNSVPFPPPPPRLGIFCFEGGIFAPLPPDPLAGGAAEENRFLNALSPPPLWDVAIACVFSGQGCVCAPPARSMSAWSVKIRRAPPDIAGKRGYTEALRLCMISLHDIITARQFVRTLRGCKGLWSNRLRPCVATEKTHTDHDLWRVLRQRRIKVYRFLAIFFFEWRGSLTPKSSEKKNNRPFFFRAIAVVHLSRPWDFSSGRYSSFMFLQMEEPRKKKRCNSIVARVLYIYHVDRLLTISSRSSTVDPLSAIEGISAGSACIRLQI